MEDPINKLKKVLLRFARPGKFTDPPSTKTPVIILGISNC
jgi:hypothetical protein